MTITSIIKRPRWLLIVLPLLVVVICISGFIYSGRNADATGVSGWNAGRIIDDAVFTNYNSMSANQIQAFLSSKVSVCDTYGAQTSEYGGGTRAQWAANASLHLVMGAFYPPFTCLKDYSENGLSAAQIIYNVSQQYHINPQVLIVLLQKEQALVTDTWPSPSQYQSATGYGCPDTAACDAKYYGLTKQLYWAATGFHAIVTNTSAWSNPYGSGTRWDSSFIIGNNSILFNPSTSCGSSTVNVQNRATAALYTYTPYQPNQAALNAGWGSAPCGAYGNRNFFLYFNAWFGSTYANDTTSPHPDGTLVNVDNSVYLIANGELHHITNGVVFESYDFRWGDVKMGTTGDKNLPISWPIDNLKPGILYVGSPEGVFTNTDENGTIVRQLLSFYSYTNLKYNWSQVRIISSIFFPTSTSATVYTQLRHPDGTLIENSNGVFLIDQGTRRYISAAVFESHHWRWGDIVSETATDQLLPIGADTLFKEGTIINDGTGLYVIKIPSSGPEIKDPIGPWECYSDMFKYSIKDAQNVSSLWASSLQTGPTISCQ